MQLITKSTAINEELDYLTGSIILVDKPLEWTSFDVVNKIRYRLKHYHNLKKIKVGHNGTLDPLASGLLMIFTGKYTKLIPEMDKTDKSYTATIKFGAETDSFDRETEEIRPKSIDHLTREKINEALGAFLGEQQQEIPFYSASKQKGVAMHRLIRRGIVPERKFKTVVFHEIELLDFEPPFCKILVKCSKGTYIRTLARDLGRRLETSSYLYGLIRTSIDSYSLEDAVNLDSFCTKLESLEYRSK